LSAEAWEQVYRHDGCVFVCVLRVGLDLSAVAWKMKIDGDDVSAMKSGVRPRR
jgi:hypothetical protein